MPTEINQLIASFLEEKDDVHLLKRMMTGLSGTGEEEVATYAMWRWSNFPKKNHQLELVCKNFKDDLKSNKKYEKQLRDNINLFWNQVEKIYELDEDSSYIYPDNFLSQLNSSISFRGELNEFKYDYKRSTKPDIIRKIFKILTGKIINRYGACLGSGKPYYDGDSCVNGAKEYKVFKEHILKRFKNKKELIWKYYISVIPNKAMRVRGGGPICRDDVITLIKDGMNVIKRDFAWGTDVFGKVKRDILEYDKCIPPPHHMDKIIKSYLLEMSNKFKHNENGELHTLKIKMKWASIIDRLPKAGILVVYQK